MRFSAFTGKVLLICVLTFSVGIICGCGSEDERDYATRKGTVEEVDLASGRVSMSYFVPKLGKSMIITGRLADDCEIYIDGKVSDITEIKENDRVIVEGYKKGDEVVATRVQVIRKGTDESTDSQTEQKEAKQGKTTVEE